MQLKQFTRLFGVGSNLPGLFRRIFSSLSLLNIHRKLRQTEPDCPKITEQSGEPRYPGAEQIPLILPVKSGQSQINGNSKKANRADQLSKAMMAITWHLQLIPLSSQYLAVLIEHHILGDNNLRFRHDFAPINSIDIRKHYGHGIV